MSGADLGQQLLAKLQTSFDEADKDGSGALSYGELYQVLTANGFKGTEDDVKVKLSLLLLMLLLLLLLVVVVVVGGACLTF